MEKQVAQNLRILSQLFIALKESRIGNTHETAF